MLNMNKVSKEILEVLVNCIDGDIISGNSLQQASPETSWDNIRMLLVTLFENGILEFYSDQ
jgi:hypothetical protein